MPTTISSFKLALVAVMLLSSFGWWTTAYGADIKTVKVGFIYTGSSRDAGWNEAHDVGRQYLESRSNGHVVTTFAENVPENADCERVMEKMIAKGNTIIFATSYGFLEPLLRVAKRHPDVRFMHCGRPVPPGVSNVGSYFTSDYFKCLYTAGVVAGKLSKTSEMGYIGGHPVPSLLWCVNAFILGARSVNPKATVQVVWLNTWEDPSMEAEAAKGLIERKCDVLVSSLNTSMTVCKVSEKSNVMSVGTNLAKGPLVKGGWLTGQKWNWGPLYVRAVKSVEDKTWKPGDKRYDFEEGYSLLAPFGQDVPKSLQEQALKTIKQLEEHKLEVFAAPLKDREGRVRLAVGQKPDLKWLNNMDFFVSGIDGALPRK